MILSACVEVSRTISGLPATTPKCTFPARSPVTSAVTFINWTSLCEISHMRASASIQSATRGNEIGVADVFGVISE